ncbi:rab proteins geranylgeranyltransferase component A 1 [Misgurnus anguillicaudatus]|uniref:rab proteins geranylgeranyltransferase component A 1 n=1 Tax=Misgurnus anguillicaudatus TaxID=75329 RepID=UPI003CCF280F
MAAEELPSQFDVVILGTGLTESVIAAACSRVGQSVLHLDRRIYYAGNWASFTFNGLLSWIEDYKNQEEVKTAESEQEWRSLIEEEEDVIPLSSVDTAISNLEVFCYASEEEEKEEETKPSSTISQPVNAATISDETNDDSTEAQDTITTDASTEAVKAPNAEGEVSEQIKDHHTSEISDLSQSQEVEEQQPISSPADPPVEVKKKITYQKLLKEGRRFNIDLVSKLMYSRGALVDLLIKSNVSRYAEFKNIGRILTCRNDKVEQVPCSRADVFASKQLTVIEKRMLMKFLTFCLDYEQHPEEYQEYSEKPFREFLKVQKLTENLQDFVLHSIAMVTQESLTEEGLKATQHFLRCLGRYGNTPFLFPLYGLGEIPQCFCRMCAVFGGIYCLRHSVQCLVVDKASNKVKAVIDTRGQRISCSHFVVEDSYIRDEQRRSTAHGQISRAVLITDRSVLTSDSDQQISLVTIPVDSSASAVRMVELCSSSMTCMPGTYLVHLTCSSSGTAQEDLAPVVSRLFHVPTVPGEEPSEGMEESSKPSVLWVMYFNMKDTSTLDNSSYSLPSNVHVCTGPDSGLGSDYSIKLAESVFHQILPDEDFCPPAPNPEDIIYDGEGPQAEGSGFDQTGNTEDEKLQTQEDESAASPTDASDPAEKTDTSQTPPTEE